MICLDVVRYIV